MPKNATRTERFWEKVRKTGSCWTWTGQRHDHGYGRLETYVPKRIVYLAHRLSWEIHFGPIPEGLQVLHKCDNPPCVNPDHLFLGTHLDNMNDMRRKGRNVRGERLPHSKLTTAAVLDIRARYAKGNVTQQALADHFGVSNSQINGVIHRNAWKHVSSEVHDWIPRER